MNARTLPEVPGHTVTVHSNTWRNYAQCTCLDENGQPWRSSEDGSSLAAWRAGERHLEEVGQFGGRR